MSRTAASSVPPPPRVFVDADVLVAGAASPADHSASLLVLRLGEAGLLDAVTSAQAAEEARRNVAENFGVERAERAADRLRRLVGVALRVVPDPSRDEVAAHLGKANPKDLPLLVAAIRERCPLLVTFNGRHFVPGDPSVEVLDPGALVRRVRGLLAGLVRSA